MGSVVAVAGAECKRCWTSGVFNQKLLSPEAMAPSPKMAGGVSPVFDYNAP